MFKTLRTEEAGLESAIAKTARPKKAIATQLTARRALLNSEFLMF
jgi:hypothetical protein